MAPQIPGDVLCGVVAGLLGQGMNPSKAAPFAVWLHGLAGDQAASAKGARSMKATDILSGLEAQLQKGQSELNIQEKINYEKKQSGLCRHPSGCAGTKPENHEKKSYTRNQDDGVIKANAYGHGAVPVAHLMEGKDYIWGYAVANVPEAEELRDAGLKKPILILGYVFPEDYQTLVKLDIRPAVFDYETAEKISQEAQKAGKVHPIHLAFDTGMTRIGFRHPKESLPEILRISKLPGITIEGAFTHFARADEQDLTSAHQQFANYQEFLTLLEEAGIRIPIRHCNNSAGILWAP